MLLDSLHVSQRPIDRMKCKVASWSKKKINFPPCLEDSLGDNPFLTQSHYYQPTVSNGVTLCTMSQSDYPTLPSDISMTVESSLRNLVLSVLSLTIKIENKDHLYAYKNVISMDTNIVQTAASDFIDDKVDDIQMFDWKSVHKWSKCWYCSDIRNGTILFKVIEPQRIKCECIFIVQYWSPCQTDVIVLNENFALINFDNTMKYKFCRQFVMHFDNNL